MRHACFCTALALLIAVGSVIPVEGRGRKARGTMTGRVAGLNPGSIAIAKGRPTKKRQPRVYNFALAPQTAVVLPNGRPAPPNALQMGARVRVAYQMTNTGAMVAAQIQVLGR
jgi:hypothetical protein